MGTGDPSGVTCETLSQWMGGACHTHGMPRTATGESSLARAVRILESFTPDEPELSVTEIARRAGLHLATASRLVGRARRPWTAQPRRPTARSASACGCGSWPPAPSPTRSLRDAAMPYLEDLHAVVGHHAQLPSSTATT